MQGAGIEAEQELHFQVIRLADRQVSGEYVRDVKTLLEESSTRPVAATILASDHIAFCQGITRSIEPHRRLAPQL